MPLDRFGVFYEIGIPKPWNENSEFDMFHRVVEQAVQADDQGYHSFWAAEQAAMLDLLSDGRLEYGVGRSSCWDEFEGFGIDPGDARPMLDEALEVMVGCWSEEVFSYEGEHFRLPPRQVIPKPRQDPHPPLWMAATGAQSHEAAAMKGLGLLSLTLATPLEEIKARLNRYKAAIPDARPVGKFVNDRAATFLITHVAETTAEAKRNAEQAAIWYVRTGLEVFSTMLSKLLIGSPDDCIAQLRRSMTLFADEVMPAFTGGAR